MKQFYSQMVVLASDGIYITVILILCQNTTENTREIVRGKSCGFAKLVVGRFLSFFLFSFWEKGEGGCREEEGEEKIPFTFSFFWVCYGFSLKGQKWHSTLPQAKNCLSLSLL